MPGYDFATNKAKFNEVSVLEFNFKIFFWRRRRSADLGSWRMELWRYDILKDDLHKVVKEVIRDGKAQTLDSYVIPSGSLNEFKQNREACVHVMFANRLGEAP